MKINKYVYSVGDAYYDVRSIWSITKLTANQATNTIEFAVNGQKYNAYIGLSQLRPGYRQEAFDNNKIVKEYKELLNEWIKLKGEN